MKGTLHLPRKKVSQDELQAVVSSNKRAGAMAEAFRKLYGNSESQQATNQQKRNSK